MPLTPESQEFLRQVKLARLPSANECTVEQARSLMPPPVEPLEQVAGIEDRQIAGPAGEIPVRIYRPAGAKPDAAGMLPGIVYYHGGGWVVGNIASHDGICRMLANRAGAITISVDYRLAPEHKFPAAVDDAYAAACWAAQNGNELGIDPKRLIVAGDSAGGNLAAAVCLMARDRGFPALACQLLFYPVTDRNFETPSYQQYAEGYYLSRDAMTWYWNHYLASDADAAHPYAAPLQASDLSNLPPAIVLVAECDPLCDEGVAYAEKLKAHGTEVFTLAGQGLLHGFLRRPDAFPEVETLLTEAARLCREVVNRGHQPLPQTEESA